MQQPALWKFHALKISAGDPVPPREPEEEQSWSVVPRRASHRSSAWTDADVVALHRLPLFKGLYFREQNWSRGIAQDVKVLKGHSNFVTSLDLHGDVLITGSYDET